ncbi:1-acyl-sn-glycerol-3-phosphate acyltransferase beta-like [Melitaea cinxia]|uniref:1-acyl-sn-glycerol-3-phosphate acyltransferase beta-like n=1 Tax=Melitaea cinxia TaxID=113334 RepID=UPI001E272722|nr:1-acyl-sn-glycerol-3-phosphate acyltransferase beta-like [Melitaea cinxia]
MRLIVGIANVVGKILGITWIMRNPEIVSEDRGAVIISNHQSILDTMHLCQLWFISRKMAITPKKALLYMWSFGFFIYMTDAIFLDRRNPTVANQLLLNKSKHLLQNKVKILIFPEGTRNDNPTKFLPFKKGAFNLAVQTQVPIIPIVISRFYFLDHRRRMFSNGNVIAQCLEPISTEGLTLDDVPDLINRIKSAMEKVYKELSNEVTKDLPPDYPLAINES